MARVVLLTAMAGSPLTDEGSVLGAGHVDEVMERHKVQVSTEVRCVLYYWSWFSTSAISYYS